MKVELERQIEQVRDRDGVEYKGILRIHQSSFEFNIVFTPGIPEQVKEQEARGTPIPRDQWRKVHQLELKKDGKLIELPDEVEWGFFVALIAPLAVEYYYADFVRNCNESPTMRASWRGEEVWGGIGSYGPIQHKRKETIRLSPEIRKWLNGPKFECSV